MATSPATAPEMAPSALGLPLRIHSATAQPIAQSMLTKYPDAQAIWAYNDPSALGAGAVVRSSGDKVWDGSQKGIIIEGANGSDEAAAGIKSGVITATRSSDGAGGGKASDAAGKQKKLLHGDFAAKASVVTRPGAGTRQRLSGLVGAAGA